MKNDSDVQFETESRIHMGLAVKSLERSVAFYTTLFGQGPTKTRPHYAKFEVAEPPVNLALNEMDWSDTPSAGQFSIGPNNPIAHFGIQVKLKTAVQLAAERLKAAGWTTSGEEDVTCCYATQNKVWAADPDGNKWEVYVVLNNDGRQHAPTQNASSGCCAGTPVCCADNGARSATQVPDQAASTTEAVSSCGCSA